MSAQDVEARWQQLDPVFIRGMQRSGTSVMTRALKRMEILGFGEGHLWFELVAPIAQLRDPGYKSDYRADVYTLGQERGSKLEKYLAVALDQFHRDALPTPLKRWQDKSPGADAVRIAPLLADLFPQAQFIFTHRNGITNVQSGLTFWSDDPDIFRTMCLGWAETMSAWRQVRDGLDGRYIEIAQEDMVTEPFEVAARLTEFLNMPSHHLAIAGLLTGRRVLSAFPDKQPGDYAYRIDWSSQQKAFFTEACGAEMEVWGYEIDFESPGVTREKKPLPQDRDGIIETLNQRDTHIAALEHECQTLRERLREIEKGRVMRVLNWLSKLQKRLAAGG